MKIGYLGAGSWGFALISLLASKGYEITAWSIEDDLIQKLNQGQDHPMLPGYHAVGKTRFTTDLTEAIQHADIIIESVTSAGLRPVFNEIKKITIPQCPIVITSKGIEQNTGYILSEVIEEVLGQEMHNRIGILSGPSYAAEVIKKQPTSVVGSAYDPGVMHLICKTFRTTGFRVYPNHDVIGVSFGGALKNVIAIACGITEGLELGHSTKAALITRGLHEIRKLSVAYGANKETLSGLTGLGDIVLTCGSMLSRNTRFGYLIAQGKTPEEAQKEIKMVVEGAYSCISAMQLSSKRNIPMPITETVKAIVYDGLKPQDAVDLLMSREIKDEHL